MWLFNKCYSLADTDFLDGFTDGHSHIFPGVDDGVQTMDEALQVLAFYESRGVKEVWLTPHIMEDIPNTTVRLRQRFEQFQRDYKGNISLRLAAEYMLDNLFEERLKAGDVLPWGGRRNALLVETSYVNPPMGFRGILSHIKSKGYYPILAHPERYLYMDVSDYQSLKKEGVYFQLNLFSLTGIYGNRVKDKAMYLLKNGLYEVIGSDLHVFPVLQRCVEQKVFDKPMLQSLCGLKQKGI